MAEASFAGRQVKLSRFCMSVSKTKLGGTYLKCKAAIRKHPMMGEKFYGRGKNILITTLAIKKLGARLC